MKQITYPPTFPADAPIIESHLHHSHPSNVADGLPAPASDSISLKSSGSKKKKSAAANTASSSSAKTSAALGVSVDPKLHAASAEDVSKLAEGLADMNVQEQDELDDPEDVFEDAEEDDSPGHTKVVYLTEQISHHPPASSYYCVAVGKGVEAAGVDQISAKVSGTSAYSS